MLVETDEAQRISIAGVAIGDPLDPTGWSPAKGAHRREVELDGWPGTLTAKVQDEAVVELALVLDWSGPLRASQVTPVDPDDREWDMLAPPRTRRVHGVDRIEAVRRRLDLELVDRVELRTQPDGSMASRRVVVLRRGPHRHPTREERHQQRVEAERAQIGGLLDRIFGEDER